MGPARAADLFVDGGEACAGVIHWRSERRTAGSPSPCRVRASMTRFLFLDDSGKPDAAHPSRAVVIGGFAIDADAYPVLSKRVLGAKGRFFPKRGRPQNWEMKSADYVKPNPWKRAVNRSFCFEIARILGSVQATVFTVTLEKSR